MKKIFNIQPTEDEVMFARMRHFRNLEFFRKAPLVLFSFSEFWDLTSGGEKRIREADVLHEKLDQYKILTILVNGYCNNSEKWSNAVFENRKWYESLNETDKENLKQIDTYANWHPGLLRNDPITIDGLLKLFPNIASGDETPKIIWKYENPESPDKLPGAVDIDTHDAIHCLLGRGALQADEAFVIGFTMGGASNELTQEHMKVFMHALTQEYPAPYNIKEEYIPSYILGVEVGGDYFNKTGIDLSKTDFSSCRDQPLEKIREKFGVDIELLSRIYTEIEELFIPYTKSPQRNRGPINTTRILGLYS